MRPLGAWPEWATVLVLREAARFVAEEADELKRKRPGRLFDSNEKYVQLRLR